MISTLRLVIGLLLRKAAPSDLPTSPRLLAATVFALVALQGLFAGAFGEDPGAVLPRALVSGVLSLGWIYLLTRIHGKPERFLQTATAMLGVMLVVTPFTLPLLVVAMPLVEAARTGQPAVVAAALPWLALSAVLVASLYLLVVQGRVKLDRFSGGLRVDVMQVWDLAGARARFGRYLTVVVNGIALPLKELLRQWPARKLHTEQGDLEQGLGVRLQLRRADAMADLDLGDQARFWPCDEVR